MLGTGAPARTNDSGDSESSAALARGGVWTLPIAALLIGLALTALLGFNRARSIDAEQARITETSRQEFRAAIENSARQVDAEVDRVQELIEGITVFAGGRDALTQATIDEYMLASGAENRFTGLVDVVVTATAPIETDTATNGPFSFETPGAETATRSDSALNAEIADRLSDTPSGRSTFLSEHTGDVPLTVVHFEVLIDGTSAGWTSLVFSTEEFLTRALPDQPKITTTLRNSNLAFQSPITSLEIENAESITAVTDREFAGERAVNVFGTRFLIEGTTTATFVPEADNGELQLIWIAGLVASLALFAVTRTLVTARRKALEMARESDAERAAIDRRFRASFQNAPIGMAELDSNGRLVAINEAFAGQSGAARSDLGNRSLSDLVHPSDRNDHLALIHTLVRGEREAAQSEHRYRHATGREVWVNESISVIDKDGDGQPSLLVQSQDVTARRRAAWELARQALHDDLTGLPNRALFLNRLNNAIERAERNPGCIAVMFIDVDRFKVINDSLGHETGDQFLIEIAERIGTAVRTGDTVARFGGDEFVVLCENVNGESEANLVAQRIQQSFKEPFILAGQPTYATVSLGITLSRGDEETADSLLRDADAAMYRAKEGGRNRTEIFNHAMRSSLVARMEIESQLRDALENGEMVLHFQAIVDPATYLPAGYEALIRWNHPEKGLLGPGAFLPVAEDAGLIHLVDSFVLRTTCRQIAEWSAKYPAARNIYVSTNWSARHLGAFVQQVEQVLGETGINPAQLVIEVTEGFLLEDSDGSLKTLKRLKELGVAIAIDDFGTGYSSLSYLTRLDVDFLKIDQSFVAKLPEDEASAAVIGAIADMAGRLGIKLIAEGVETDAQMHMLAQLGSPRLQGYRFAKPRPASHISQHLAERSAVNPASPIDPESPRVLTGNPVG